VLANQLNLNSTTVSQLKKLGTYINYNGYGSCIEDLHFPPAQLYQEMIDYSSPTDFIANNPLIYKQLESGYLEDMHSAEQIQPEFSSAAIAVYLLPDQTWARRISGVFSNDLANQYPDRANAVITHTPAGDYQVSVRAPLNNKSNADKLCASFPTGGGRMAAAGINHLPTNKLENFISKFNDTY